jgi:hypothetical protein
MRDNKVGYSAWNGWILPQNLRKDILCDRELKGLSLKVFVSPTVSRQQYPDLGSTSYKLTMPRLTATITA